MPVKKNYYRCDKHFHVELVKDLFAVHVVVGTVIISGEETSIWNITGTQTILKRKFTCHRQKKQKCGGQSAPRFQRIRENQIHEYVGKIIENISAEFTPGGTLNVAAVIIAGAAFIRDKVIGDERIPQIIKNSMTISSSEKISEIVNESASVISRATGNNIDKELADFFEKIELGDPKYIYGKNDIAEAMKQKIVKTIYTVDKNLDMYTDQGAEVKIVAGGIWSGKLAAFGGTAAILWYDPGDYLLI